MSQPDNFKALQKAWYKKLRDEGFDDIEQDEENLKVWHSHFFANRLKNRHTQSSWASKEEYFRVAGQFLHDHEFLDPLDKAVWELHANGLPVTKIVDELRSRRPKIKTKKKITPLLIRNIVKMLVKEMIGK
jgi:hypothetical protein